MANPQVKEYPNCFGCGESNPKGLRLKLRMEGKFLTTEFVPQDEHQGWPGIVHGGIIGALLYEVMGNFPYYLNIIAMMKSSETRFRRPAETGKQIIARSWLAHESGRNMNVSATLTGEGDELIAEGNAVLVKLSQNQMERLGLA